MPQSGRFAVDPGAFLFVNIIHTPFNYVYANESKSVAKWSRIHSLFTFIEYCHKTRSKKCQKRSKSVLQVNIIIKLCELANTFNCKIDFNYKYECCPIN